MQKAFSTILCLCLCVTAAVFSGCGGASNQQSTVPAAAEPASADEIISSEIDYTALVNKTHKLSNDWEKKLQTVHMTNSIGDDVEVEKKSYDAYLKLKADLEKDSVFVDLDSARRSVADQQRIMDEFTEQYGKEYALKTVATPGFSEHHTGLALDLYLIIDGKDVTENEDMVKYPGIWDKIHAKLADYGFILRYLDGREYITGYGYEPWHIRYIDDPKKAREITDKNITFEEYLGAYKGGKAVIDYGTSTLYSEEDLKAAAVQVACRFASFGGCELRSLKYAGDEAVSTEKLSQINRENPGRNYTKAAEFLMDFYTTENPGDTTLEAFRDYTDYPWWLARTDKDGWEIIRFGN